MPSEIMNNKFVALIFASIMIIGSIAVVVAPASDADTSYTVKDGTGKEVKFDSVPNKIITIGKGLTATAIQIGTLDKIVVCDKYSYTASEDLFKDLKTKVDSKKIAANGTIYSSGTDALKTDIIDAADPVTGTFDKERDVLIMTGSTSYLNPLVSYFESLGFQKILIWKDITEYDDLVDFVKEVSKAAMGSVSPQADRMEYVANEIEKKLTGVTKTNAFFVNYSSSNWVVGNYGSLANSMILAAGGNVVTLDEAKKSTYAANITEVYDESGDGTIVFIDSTVAKNSERMSTLKTMIPEKSIVPLESLWNNFDVESMTGVWTMACAMYPDIFSGDVPSVPSNSNNTVAYIAAGVVAVLAILGIAYYFMKK